MRARLACLPALALAVAVCACSDDDDSASDSSDESTTTTEAPEAEQVCTDWAQTQSAVAALADVDVVNDGTDALRAAVDGVSETLQPLRASAGEQVGSEVDALGDAVDTLVADVGGLGDGTTGEGGDDGAGSGLVAVGEAIQGVSAAAQDLGTALQPDCDT